jgi:putative flippase GtrA
MPDRLNRLLARPLRFALVGMVNTLVGLLVIYAAKWTAGLSDLPANLLGYAAGLSVSYTLNARWTFAFHGRQGVAALRFVLVIVAAYLANIATVYAALGLAVNSYIAQAAGIVPYAVIGYLGTSLFAFRDPHSCTGVYPPHPPSGGK